MIDPKLAWSIFLGTLPILVAVLGVLGVIVWNLIEIKGLRAEVAQIRIELAKLTERVAILEERDRWTHPSLKP